MEYRRSIIGFILVISIFSCKEDWNEHYGTVVETVDMNVWDAIQKEGNLSSFVQYVKDFKFDTLFITDQTYTIFVPDNQAFAEFLDTGNVTIPLLNYHISQFFMQSGHISGKRRIQTLGEKLALFEKSGNEEFFDGIPVTFESPLYLNGKYFVLSKVAIPKPNLYEYFEANNTLLKKYIDSQDSIVLDKELSRPLGFDENGNTIYDTVSIIFNLFEEEFFPVKEELRYKTATIVFPKEEDYNNALTNMAQSIGAGYQDYHDIPLDWQNEILIPYLLEQGVFENMLEENEFMLPPGRDTLKLKNILGDSIVIEYHPVEKTICSNGYAYNYADFNVPDTLYASPWRYEGEWLLKDIGINKYAWNEDVTVLSDIAFQPIQELVSTASNDSILKVNFTPKYAGNFSVEFNVENLFPRKYLMVVRTYMNVGGIYDIYMNDELVKTIDYYDFILNRGLSYSVIPGKRYLPSAAGYNNFDCWIENLTVYGHASIRFEYKEPGSVPYNGLVIDYIEFIPY